MPLSPIGLFPQHPQIRSWGSSWGLREQQQIDPQETWMCHRDICSGTIQNQKMRMVLLHYMRYLLAVVYGQGKEAGLVHLLPVAHGRHHHHRAPLPRHHEAVGQLGDLYTRARFGVCIVAWRVVKLRFSHQDLVCVFASRLVCLNSSELHPAVFSLDIPTYIT